ncbi:hypothetical protein LIER_27283 [Lithospermum erythrorhizon]|uniref:Uncharacterized protein n=1 Tax=Lithospermum erythrorhizon TaxID=34254 RepID=A0AAV3RBR6_LITER
MTYVGGQDGNPRIHALGSKGIHEWMYKEEKRTGKTPSELNILLDRNKKKHNATEEPTGDIYNPKLEKAYGKYLALFYEQYGEDADPLQAPWDKTTCYLVGAHTVG